MTQVEKFIFIVFMIVLMSFIISMGMKARSTVKAQQQIEQPIYNVTFEYHLR